MPEFESENQNVQETTERITYTYLKASTDFLERIKAIQDNSILAKFLCRLSYEGVYFIPNVNGSIDYLGVSVDDPTKISYLTYERALSAFTKNENTRVWEDKNYRYHSGAGKVIRKLLSATHTNMFLGDYAHSPNAFNQVVSEVRQTYGHFVVPENGCFVSEMFTEADFDTFNNLFRVEGFRQGDTSEVVFVKGHWIKEMYHEKNYASLSGTLGNSCMRYERTNQYLDIYVKNPSICKLAVLLNSLGQVQARALVWTVDGIDYHDRIYYTSDLIHDRMKAFFLTNNIETCARQYSGNKTIKIQADPLNKDFDKRVLFTHDYYPYMDNLTYLGEDRTVLTNDANCFQGEEYLILNSTGGGYDSSAPSTVECNCCGRETDEDSIFFIDCRRDDNRGESLCEDCAVYSDVYGEYITRDDAAFLEGRQTWALLADCIEDYLGTYILGDDAVELVNGQYAHTDDSDLSYYVDGDAFLMDHSSFPYVEYNGEYYKVEDCVEDREGNTYPERHTTEYEGEIWLTDNLDKHLNLNLI